MPSTVATGSEVHMDYMIYRYVLQITQDDIASKMYRNVSLFFVEETVSARKLIFNAMLNLPRQLSKDQCIDF